MIQSLFAAAVLVLAPLAAFAAEDSHASSGVLVWQIVNLAILLAVLFYAARKPVRKFFAKRRGEIQENLENAAQLLAQAESRLTDWQERTNRLDADISEIRAGSERLAEEQRERILAQAREAAARIRRDATAAVDQELRKARASLRTEAAELAVKLAAGMLQDAIDDRDRARLVDEFVEHVERPGSQRSAES